MLHGRLRKTRNSSAIRLTSVAGGGYPVNRWEQIDGKWYCFGEDRYLRYGWINWNGKWYYTGSDGAMLVNCRTPDNYYVGGDGAWIQ